MTSQQVCGKRPSNLLQPFFIFAQYFVAKKTFSGAIYLQLIWCVDAACFVSCKCRKQSYLMITVKTISSEETLCWQISQTLKVFLNFSTSCKLNLSHIFHPIVENSEIIQNHTNWFHKKQRYRRSHELYAHVHPQTMCCILEQKNPKLSVFICLPSVVFLNQKPKVCLIQSNR